MKYSFNTEGGFAGLMKEFNGDSANLPIKLNSIFEQLIFEKNKYQNLPTNTQARDLIKYTLNIETLNGTVSFFFNDLNIPEELFPLINYCSEKAEMK